MKNIQTSVETPQAKHQMGNNNATKIKTKKTQKPKRKIKLKGHTQIPKKVTFKWSKLKINDTLGCDSEKDPRFISKGTNDMRKKEH